MKTKLLLLISLGVLVSGAEAQNVQQSTVIDTVPNTMVIDSSDVKLPSSCQFRGPVSRGFGATFGNNKGAMRKLRKAADEVDANVIVVTILNTNSGIPMSGLGYHCSDLTAVTPSLKVFVLPE